MTKKKDSAVEIKRRHKLAVQALLQKLEKMQDRIIQMGENFPLIFDERDKERMISLGDDIGNTMEWFESTVDNECDFCEHGNIPSACSKCEGHP